MVESGGLGRWPFAQWRVVIRLAAVLLPFATCAVLSAFRDQVAASTSVLTLVLWVVGAAATGDRLAGLLAAVSSGAWFDFFLTEPFNRFAISKHDDVVATVLLVLISIGVTEIALWGHRQHVRASRRSGYLEGVLGTAQAVAEGDVPSYVLVDVVARQIAEVLNADSCRFVPGPVQEGRIAVLDHDGTITRDGHTVDVDRVGLPSDEYVAILVREGTHVVGHYLLTAATNVTYPSREQRRVAVLLADQVAGALEAN
jgi:K+-sensing histidine kinase KdpD